MQTCNRNYVKTTEPKTTEPRTNLRALRALLMTDGTQTMKTNDLYVELYGPYQVMLNVDGIGIYAMTYVT